MLYTLYTGSLRLSFFRVGLTLPGALSARILSVLAYTEVWPAGLLIFNFPRGNPRVIIAIRDW